MKKLLPISIYCLGFLLSNSLNCSGLSVVKQHETACQAAQDEFNQTKQSLGRQLTNADVCASNNRDNQLRDRQVGFGQAYDNYLATQGYNIAKYSLALQEAQRIRDNRFDEADRIPGYQFVRCCARKGGQAVPVVGVACGGISGVLLLKAFIKDPSFSAQAGAAIAGAKLGSSLFDNYTGDQIGAAAGQAAGEVLVAPYRAYSSLSPQSQRVVKAGLLFGAAVVAAKAVKDSGCALM